MTTSTPPDALTLVLQQIAAGEVVPVDALLPLVYDELRAVAGRYMRHERPDHTLQPTALVHEAVLRLLHGERVPWENRAVFVAVAAQVMRRVLVDHSRRRSAHKRGHGERVELTDAVPSPAPDAADLVAVDDALARLAEVDERLARVVELRVFGGLQLDEVADALGVSRATVKRDWALARAWLRRALSDE